MSDEALDLRRSARILRRHIITVIIAAGLGLLAGSVFALVKPPMRASSALVLLPPAVRGAGAEPARFLATQLVLAVSNPVLTSAARAVDPPVPVPTLRSRIIVSSPSADIITFTAQGTTTAQAEDIANAVARSYIARLRSPGSLGAGLLQPAVSAVGTSGATRVAVDGGLGALLGALAGSILVLATRRDDRRLRERDEIADATGVPVLASIPVCHPSDAAGWTKLFRDYQPDPRQAWSLRKTLHELGLTESSADGARGGHGARLAMVSLSSDRGALALGPQLAVFAAAQGIPTTLVLGPPEDAHATAALRAACAAPPAAPRDRPGQLRVSMAASDGAGEPPGHPADCDRRRR